MIAKVYDYSGFHECRGNEVEMSGYIGKFGDFVPDNADDLLAVEGACGNPECLCGSQLRADLPDGTTVTVVA